MVYVKLILQKLKAEPKVYECVLTQWTHDVVSTSATSYRRLTDVEPTLCVYWVSTKFQVSSLILRSFRPGKGGGG